MRRSTKIMATGFLALLLSAAVGSEFASAQNVHFKQNRNPAFIDQGLTLNAAGTLVGLGNGDVVVFMSATADATATCTNPSGSNQPPGQNPAPVTVAGSQAIPEEEIKNGNLNFSVTTNPPTNPIPPTSPDFSCPSKNWTMTITDLKFTSATLRFEQDGVLVLTATCTFPAPTSNGAVPRSNVTCTLN